MNIIMGVQLTFFCDHHIKTSVDSITTLMQELNKLNMLELLPSVIPGQKLDLLVGKAVSTTNLGFNSPTGNVQIACMDNRIDCTVKPEANENLNLEDALSKCETFLNVILKQYSIQGNRLAINIDVLGKEINSDIKDTQCGNKIASCIGYYKDKSLDDLSARLNTRVPITISNSQEMVNIITNINSATNNQTNNKLLICHIDINTVPEKQDLRFKSNDLKIFIDEIQDIIHQIFNDFEVIDNDKKIN